MEAARLLLLVFIFQGGGCDGKDETYCTEQRGSVHVALKGSVTLTCNFTCPKEKSGEVRVSWRRGLPDRCGGGDFIYNHTGDWTHSNYTGRISPVGNHIEDGSATITIRDLRRTDRPMFCCRVEIHGGSKPEGWQNRHGTYMLYKDEFSVHQADVVSAIIGEDVTIPCDVHYKDPDLIEEVTWTMGSSDLCADDKENSVTWNHNNRLQIIRRWSMMDFPRNVSLIINKVTSEDNKYYCCSVRTRVRRDNTATPIHATQLVVVDTSQNSAFEVQQPELTSPTTDGSATLSCSYRPPYDTDPLWTEVFWRVGSPSGIYAYHPFPEMVHSSYRGRTELRGPADLHIKGANIVDNTTYYCFVLLKFCTGNNIIDSTIRCGNGTKLMLSPSSRDDEPNNNTWIYVITVVLVVVISLCVVVILFYLKKKGVICQKHIRRDDINDLTSDIALTDQHSPGIGQISRDPSGAPPMAQEDCGGVLYAHLNVANLQQNKSSGSNVGKPANDHQVVYASVKPTGAPQDIYSTVKPTGASQDIYSTVKPTGAHQDIYSTVNK
ncbi:hypothetical protein GDO81_008869 [Engystomops pustulosus]|uniref:Ig-like domain-containing protein n=2 Tax=Engystomops pustulosus TaxID=76066 RepID=A0AAV7BNB3_ENGPU|nr:hypothetical protein GDO81_008869 [Engystomops pustulosus]